MLHSGKIQQMASAKKCLVAVASCFNRALMWERMNTVFREVISQDWLINMSWEDQDSNLQMFDTIKRCN